MKITHVLGHNSNWNVDSYTKNSIGDYFLITAFTHGVNFESKTLIKKIIDVSMIDLQFYGKNVGISKGKLNEFPFHTCNIDDEEITNIYFVDCAKRAVKFQMEKGFKNIIIPLYYENEETQQIIYTIKTLNKYISTLKNKEKHKYYMTLPFANHVIIDKNKVEEILFECTDMDICFDGYFITCENKPEQRKKLTTDIKILKNLSRVLSTLKQQKFKTIYAYANWDALIYLAQTDIDYLTIGTYENLRNFDISRYTEEPSGGGSKGYYFSEKLLNMVKADDMTTVKGLNGLKFVKNDKNIFSDIILEDNYLWNIHKPDVNKNYLLSISKLLNQISNIKNLKDRKAFVLNLIEEAIENYYNLEDKKIYLSPESSNYHLNLWKSYLLNA
tara:strand:- start:1745 stop:2902 length:1158 start_codon:yes stop_codon:yes gene_type:complete